jgi:hypothetical protein
MARSCGREAALHVQVSARRKILGNEAIATVSGQGYRFALPVTKVEPQASAKHNLPSQLTSFIGREREIAQLKELLTTNRLVTLTGAGGAGKTRLALQAASQLLDAFADGVWLVELAALSDPSLVTQAVVSALDQQEQPGRPLTRRAAHRAFPRKDIELCHMCQRPTACRNRRRRVARHDPLTRAGVRLSEALHGTRASWKEKLEECGGLGRHVSVARLHEIFFVRQNFGVDGLIHALH